MEQHSELVDILDQYNALKEIEGHSAIAKKAFIFKKLDVLNLLFSRPDGSKLRDKLKELIMTCAQMMKSEAS